MNDQSIRPQHIWCLRITNPMSLLVWAAVLVLLGAALSWAAPAIVAKPVITGLSNPIAITNAGDGSDRLFIALQNGRIIIYDGTQVLPTPFLDISSLVSSGSERGLLSVACHPNHASNGFFFVNYTNIRGYTIIARYSISANPNIADPSSALTLLTINQPFSNHNGGQLQFGPDGYLYIGMGDGGSGGDPQNNAQKLNTLLGKMLRIDVDGGFPYAIPPDNPFLGTFGARDEIWSPLAAHINMVAVNPTGKGNLQAFPVGAGTGTGLSVNYNTIDTNLANAGTVKTITGTGPDITVASNFSSAHTAIDVLGYYYPAP